MDAYLKYIDLYKFEYMKSYVDEELGIELMVLDTDKLILNECEISKIIPEDRFMKFLRMKEEKDKKLLFGSEILLMCGCIKYQINYNKKVYSKYGKPYIENSYISFNISHSGKYVICSFSKFEVGCDIELIGEVYMDVAERFFNQIEVVKLLSITEDKQKQKLFYDMWVLKESFIKNVGKGLNLGLKDYFFVQKHKNLYEVIQTINEFKYVCRLFNIDDSYSAAVCILLDD